MQENGMISDQNMATKFYNEKSKWINNMTKELEGPKEGLKMEIHIGLPKTTLKNIKLQKART